MGHSGQKGPNLPETSSYSNSERLRQEYEAVVLLDQWFNVDDLSARVCKTRSTTTAHTRRAAYVGRQVTETIPE